MPALKIYFASEENLDTRYTKLKEQKEQLENDLNAANKLVGDLKKTNKDAEELQQRLLIMKPRCNNSKLNVPRSATSNTL